VDPVEPRASIESCVSFFFPLDFRLFGCRVATLRAVFPSLLFFLACYMWVRLTFFPRATPLFCYIFPRLRKFLSPGVFFFLRPEVVIGPLVSLKCMFRSLCPSSWLAFCETLTPYLRHLPLSRIPPHGRQGLFPAAGLSSFFFLVLHRGTPRRF